MPATNSRGLRILATVKVDSQAVTSHTYSYDYAESMSDNHTAAAHAVVAKHNNLPANGKNRLNGDIELADIMVSHNTGYVFPAKFQA